MEKLEYRFKKFISRKENRNKYYISTDGLVCCKGSVEITDVDIVNGHLPFKFGKVYGIFDFYNCPSLTSLEGAPQEVGRNFYCRNCPSLKPLEGVPTKIGRRFIK